MGFQSKNSTKIFLHTCSFFNLKALFPKKTSTAVNLLHLYKKLGEVLNKCSLIENMETEQTTKSNAVQIQKWQA